MDSALQKANSNTAVLTHLCGGTIWFWDTNDKNDSRNNIDSRTLFFSHFRELWQNIWKYLRMFSRVFKEINWSHSTCKQYADVHTYVCSII